MSRTASATEAKTQLGAMIDWTVEHGDEIVISGRASYEVISDQCLELPNFDYRRYNMRDGYRYVYGVSIHPQQRQGFYNQMLKVEMETGATQTWYQPGCYPGEPVFVGRPDRTAQDDGALLSVVLDARTGASFLLVLNATTPAQTTNGPWAPWCNALTWTIRPTT